MMKLIGAAALALSLAPALAQYKVVGPDGRVTYTDRPAPQVSGKAAPMATDRVAISANTGSSNASLPLELRQVASKFPVTLYTAADCAPCDNARQLLRGRGIPFTEKRVSTQDDGTAYERIIGARTLPGATIGPQQLRGLNAADWHAYLDAAGYPRESRLPRGWQGPAVTPVVEVAAAPPAPAAPSANARSNAPAIEPPPPPPGSIRF